MMRGIIRRASSITPVLSPGLARRQTSEFRISVVRFYSDDLSNRPGPLARYGHLVQQGKLQKDPYQEKVALELENLFGRLEQYEKDMEEYHENLAKWIENRENERRRLLTQEAESQYMEGAWTRNKVVERWISKKKPVNMEPGVGKWVSYLKRERKLDSLVGRRPIAPPAPKGLYLYGNVGSGKTMLMDMFYSATEGMVKHRRRIHFHEAMLQIHEHMHEIWKNQVEEKTMQSGFSNWIRKLPFDMKIKEWIEAEERYKQAVQLKNILPAVADKFLVDAEDVRRGASILCFDEIQTVDVFAIVALSGILSRLLSTGTVLVATSNRAPHELNQDGMQREIFLKFVAKLEEQCEIVPIGSEIDYRRIIGQGSPVKVHYFSPLNSTTIKEFENTWSEVTRQYGGIIASATLPVMFGRTLEVPECCNGIARFSFEYLCGRPIGAADYIALAKNFHTVFITDIPSMSMRIRDKARRFITLIDELYNHHCSLYCLAAASIDDLFQGTEEGKLFDLESFQFEGEIEGGKLRRNVLEEGSISTGGTAATFIAVLSGEEEMFAFRRAVSRLIEMQTPFYLEGVKNLHPHFQSTRQSWEKNTASTLQSQQLS